MGIAAIVPAAGRSRRMGRPKLLLPIAGEPLILRVVRSLIEGGAGRVVVVAPAHEAEWSAPLVAAAGGAGAEVVVPPSPPADMRASVELGLDRLEGGAAPPRIVLLTPGDSPGLTRALVAAVVDAAQDEPGTIVVPRFEGRRGHPLALPWPLARSIRDLPADVGVNALLARHAASIRELSAGPGALADLDTPEDYRRWASTP